MSLRVRLAGVLVAVLAACATVPVADASASALPGLTTGFYDPIFTSLTPGASSTWLTRAKQEGAGVVRLGIYWFQVAPQRPPSEAEARNPGWSGYEWAAIDLAVRNAAANGLTPLITISYAPAWAEGAGRPSTAPAGTWRPSPTALAAFAAAAARRYSGTYTPPGSTEVLPRVRYWQAWNEPNLSVYLTPQWRSVGHGFAPSSPAMYRTMLNDFYAAVKGVNRTDLVLTGGTAPYGEEPGGERMQPGLFVREMFCLRSLLLVPEHCPEKAHFDILDHHPYSAEGPYFHAINFDDIAIADIAKLTRPLRRAEALHLVGGPRHHPIWVTELAWNTNPPNSGGISLATQARWLQQSLKLLWQQGVSTVLWFLIVDQPPAPLEEATFEAGGLYFQDGQPKPSAQAFHFPFVVSNAGRAGLELWGKAPGHGRVSIERSQHGTWQTVRTSAPSAGGVFDVHLRLAGHPLLRARQGSELSLEWQAGG